MIQKLNGVASAMEQINLDSYPITKEQAKTHLIDSMEEEPYKVSKVTLRP